MKRIFYWIIDRPVLISFIVLFLCLIGIIALSLKYCIYQADGFLGNVIVEAHGMLLDIVVFGIIILSFNQLTERRRTIQGYNNEIDFFRGWESEEGLRRTVGNIRLLNDLGFTAINLHHCYLVDANLRTVDLSQSFCIYVNLQKANLYESKLNKAFLMNADLTEANLCNANLNEAYLYDANLEGAYLGDANLLGAQLRGVKNLTAEQIINAKNIFGIKDCPKIILDKIEEYGCTEMVNKQPSQWSEQFIEHRKKMLSQFWENNNEKKSWRQYRKWMVRKARIYIKK